MLAIVILAAGKGTRMNSDLPKVLHRLGGLPLLQHVLRTARELEPERVVVIVGHRREEVIEEIKDSGAVWVVQEPQLGTGHAVRQAEPLLAGCSGSVIVLSGDVPMLRASTLKRLIQEHNTYRAAATVLTTTAPDPKGYGRIVRNTAGDFVSIVEEREASAAQKQITEVNSGVYCFDCALLFDALRDVKADNSKGEYYLTDVIELLRGRGHKAQAFKFAEFEEVQGINTPAELAQAEASWREKRIPSAT